MSKRPPGLGIHVSPREADYLFQSPPRLNTVARLVDSAPLPLAKESGTSSSNEAKGRNFYKQSTSTVDLAPDWQGSEIDIVLGNEKSRLKSGARLLPYPSGEQKGLALEKAKRRSRVDVDIYLESDICVESGYLQGLVKVFVRKGSKKSQAIQLSGGKIRVIGFENIAKDEERFLFYQCCADLSDVSSGPVTIYCSEPDDEGFMRANEGIHELPFSLRLTTSQEHGKPKGYFDSQSGVSIRYIAMVSFRIKDPASGKMSISHFYRDCCVWPRLNPSVVLSPATRPIQTTMSDGLVLGEIGKVALTASLHRLHWVAGQLCHVKFDVTNNSKKYFKILTLEVFQTLSTFKRKKSKLEPADDTYYPTTTTKQIAHSTLTMGQAGTRAHASAMGWWVGIPPKSSQTFSHSIHLPADSLSIPRGKLIEVSHRIKATISPGTFLSTDIQISIPIEIISFLSIDPPPPPVETHVKPLRPIENAETNVSQHPDEDDEGSFDDYSNGDIEELGNLSVDDDTDEVVQHVVSSARIDEENAPRFSDLYYSSFQGPSEISEEQRHAPNPDINKETVIPKLDPEAPKKITTHFADRVEKKMAERKNALAGADGEIFSDSNEDGGSTGSNKREANLLIMPPDNRELPVNDIIDANIQPSELNRRTTPPRKTMPGSKSNPVTPKRHPSIEMLTNSATRPKSVRDKIRELEELAASSSDDV